MAKKPSLDPVQEAVRSVFRRNRDLTRSSSRDKDNLARYDLEEPKYSRRMRAVVNLYQQFIDRFAEKYAMSDVEKSFAHVSSLPISTYDRLDDETSFLLGAAIWMLDHLKDAGHLQDACELLPVETEAYMPDVYDTCYGFDVLAGMLRIIHERNDADTIANTSEPESVFRKLLDMIPDMDKELAIGNFKERFWNWADLYFQGLDKLLTENYKNSQALTRLLKQCKAYDEEHFKPKKSAPLMMMAKRPVSATTSPLTATPPLFGKREPDDPRRQMQDMIDRMERLRNKMDEVLDRCSDYQLMAPQVCISDKRRVQEIAGEELTNALCKFPIADPYEICFAVLYMFDQDDDYIWTYGFALAIATRAASMLPWGQNRYDADEDVYEPVKLEPKWYASDYVEDVEIDGAFYDSSLAQIVYEYSGGVLPRTMGRYDRLKPVLKKRGLKPAQIATACALMDVLCEASRTCERVGIAGDKSEEAEDGIAEKAIERENAEIDTVAFSKETVSNDADLAAENERLRKELAQLREQSKKQLYEASRENRELKEQLRVAAQEKEENVQELADLREIVFNHQLEQEEVEETKISFPCHTKLRAVVFGGHDSWLREIKFKLPDVRFYGENLSSPEVIRKADVVWIQSNCIGHKSFYGIIDLCRRYNKKVRYFKYASAAKCAEQVVEDEK